MQLTTTQTQISLATKFNGSSLDVVPVGSNVRFINLTKKLAYSMRGWLIRETDTQYTATASGLVATMGTASDSDNLRVGEVVHVWDSSDNYIGSIVIQSISGAIVNFTLSNNTKFIDPTTGSELATSTMAKIAVESDPILVESFPREFQSNRHYNLIVKAESACELSMIVIDRTGTKQ